MGAKIIKNDEKEKALRKKLIINMQVLLHHPVAHICFVAEFSELLHHVGDDEGGKVTHGVEFLTPFVHGIAVGHDKHLATTETLEAVTGEHSLVACCYPHVFRPHTGTEDSVLGTLHKDDGGGRKT